MMYGKTLAVVMMAVTSSVAPPHYRACAAGHMGAEDRHEEQRATTLTIRAKLLVDAQERSARKRWEERLRKRLEAASDILQQTCGVRFEPVAIETWDSDPTITGIQESLREFAQKVNPAPGEVAIGFTSKLREGPNCNWLGVTGGLLHSHILVREWYGAATEVERLEVLLHELGHYLGAAHSAEPDSVMRPRLGDGKARLRKFHIGFDALNSRAMNLIAEAMRPHDLRALVLLQPQGRSELQAIYEHLSQGLPDDPLAAGYLKQLRPQTDKPPEVASRSTPLVVATRKVLAALVQCAEQVHKARSPDAEKEFALDASDQLTESYFRDAATVAANLPPEHAVPAYLLALGVAIDRSSLLRRNFLTRELWTAIESESERTHRLGVIGTPTIWSRHDLAQHFAVSAALAAVVGPKAARELGLMKEMSDAQRGGGFSFADLAADLAGITLADHLRTSQVTLRDLAESFRIERFVPEPTGLQEGLSWQVFVESYGSFSDQRFRSEEARIQQMILSLAGYQVTTQ